MIRPVRLLVIGLSVAGLARGSSLLSGEDVPSLFVSAAWASPPKAAPEPEPEDVVEPEIKCDIPEEMLRAITTERSLLNDQKQALAQRDTEIQLASEKLAIETGRLSDLKVELEAVLARIEQVQSDDVNRLVALYSNMKPQEAAMIMNELDLEVSVIVLGLMPERDAAPILATMDMTRARAISKIIFERSKLPGDQNLNNIKL